MSDSYEQLKSQYDQILNDIHNKIKQQILKQVIEQLNATGVEGDDWPEQYADGWDAGHQWCLDRVHIMLDGNKHR